VRTRQTRQLASKLLIAFDKSMSGWFWRTALSRHENPTSAGTPHVNFCLISIFHGIIVRENLSEVLARAGCFAASYSTPKTVKRRDHLRASERCASPTPEPELSDG
jgi:hypothetical protein